MNEEQWFGLAGLVIGLYWFVCATWKRDFALYAWNARRAVKMYGEDKTHRGFQVAGVVVTALGAMKLAGLF